MDRGYRLFLHRLNLRIVLRFGINALLFDRRGKNELLKGGIAEGGIGVGLMLDGTGSGTDHGGRIHGYFLEDTIERL
jgi:hypothetical protein